MKWENYLKFKFQCPSTKFPWTTARHNLAVCCCPAAFALQWQSWMVAADTVLPTVSTNSWCRGPSLPWKSGPYLVGGSLFLQYPMPRCYQLCVQISCSCKDTSDTGLGLTLWSNLNLIISVKTLSLTLHSEILGVRNPASFLTGCNSTHNSLPSYPSPPHRIHMLFTCKIHSPLPNIPPNLNLLQHQL